jgi:hypothetical protein
MKKSFWILGLMMAGIISLTGLTGCKDKDLESRTMYGFTVQNWRAKLARFPTEDSYAFDEQKKIATVADGITRDFSDGTNVTSGISSLIKSWEGKYPLFAKDASEISTNAYMKTKSLFITNERLNIYQFKARLNLTDYLAKDFAGCTASGIFEENGFLNWQFIADSGIAIFRGEDLEFKTSNEGPNSKGSIDKDILEKYGLTFNDQEGRRIIRSQYRNNPSNPLAYGALTGEKAAERYIRSGKESLQNGNYVLLFTDGVGDIIFLKDGTGREAVNSSFVNTMLEDNPSSLRNFCQKRVSREGSLVVWKVD